MLVVMTIAANIFKTNASFKMSESAVPFNLGAQNPNKYLLKGQSLKYLTITVGGKVGDGSWFCLLKTVKILFDLYAFGNAELQKCGEPVTSKK